MIFVEREEVKYYCVVSNVIMSVYCCGVIINRIFEGVWIVGVLVIVDLLWKLEVLIVSDICEYEFLVENCVDVGVGNYV